MLLLRNLCIQPCALLFSNINKIFWKGRTIGDQKKQIVQTNTCTLLTEHFLVLYLSHHSWKEHACPQLMHVHADALSKIKISGHNSLGSDITISIIVTWAVWHFVLYHTCTYTATVSGPTGSASGQSTFVNTGVPIIAAAVGAIPTAAITCILFCYKQYRKRSKYSFNCSYGN